MTMLRDEEALVSGLFRGAGGVGCQRIRANLSIDYLGYRMTNMDGHKLIKGLRALRLRRRSRG